mgnify:CR=1 FL=1
MKVLALASYPVEAAATRFRIAQFVKPLGERGIDVTIRPFLDAAGFAALYSGGSPITKAAAMFKPVALRVADVTSATRSEEHTSELQSH